MVIIVGLILILNTTGWLFVLVQTSSNEFNWEAYHKTFVVSGAWSLIGLGLIIIGMIVTHLVKSDK